jgi:Mannosylglycerate hydrolase MGH1-like glycoside hydrolase domain
VAHSYGAKPEAERLRQDEQYSGKQPWHLWGPYLSERQWGTVREDYSPLGTPWEYFPHDHARSRAYRWGEDGLAGFSDHQQRLCVSIALWNGRDPILKERLFGLTNAEGNHGEDVKELYYYLDATPTHSYLKYLYKYPQSEFPYRHLVEENRRRGKDLTEFELLDTGVFDENRYFDVYVEYAKADVRDILMCITVHNRGPETASIHVLPQLWFRNTWSWSNDPQPPRIIFSGPGSARASHRQLGDYYWYADNVPPLLFCDNETNTLRHYGLDVAGHFKDAFHEYVIHNNKLAVRAERHGTKAAAHYVLEIAPGACKILRLRLASEALAAPFDHFDRVLEQRRAEADAFYAALQAGIDSEDVARIQRQSLAGMIWGKQYYHIDIPRWLKGDPAMPPPPAERLSGRNSDWEHLNNADVISMPDKWEYPWYAAWDLAFQCLPLALVDAEFAKNQLILLTREWYMHPNGQLPAYEWDFGDVNPPVHAWATWEVYCLDRDRRGGKGDLAFLERVLHKLMLNFTWWVNRKDAEGRNVFQGGFLGMDNIGVFDRSSPLSTGGHLDQADGTSWMAMYSLNLMRIALELALHNPVYEDISTKFFEHFLYIAAAMNNIGGKGIGLWDDEDRFFYDVLSIPGGRNQPIKVRSIVGLMTLCAVEVLEPELLERLPGFKRRLEWFLKYDPDVAALVSHWEVPGRGATRLLSLLRADRMKHLLKRMLDESEFLSDYGIRALSRIHADQPYVFDLGGETMRVAYCPAESQSVLFGGNSNWRGPIWFPVNYLLIDSLRRFHNYYGNEFRVEHPTGSGRLLTLQEIAGELSQRLVRIFARDDGGRRPVFGGYEHLQNDPHFRDHILFHEYFHGDNGQGVGASHQTGWTGLVANLIYNQNATMRTSNDD